MPAKVEPMGRPCFPMVVELPGMGAAGSDAAAAALGAVDAALLGSGVVDVVGGGGISVFSTLVPFFFGLGAVAVISVMYHYHSILTGLTILILGHVESAQQHDGFFPVVASFRDKSLMCIEKVPDG